METDPATVYSIRVGTVVHAAEKLSGILAAHRTDHEIQERAGAALDEALTQLGRVLREAPE